MSRQRITREDVLDAIRDCPGATINQIMASTGGTRISVEQHLLRLRAAKLVENRGYAGGTFPGGKGRESAWHFAPTKLERPRVNSVFALAAAL